MLPVLIAAGLLIGGAIIVANWDSIVNWVKDFIPKLVSAWESVRAFVPYEFVFVGDLICEGAKALARIMNKLYYKEDGQWMEETTTRTIDESEVPPHIRAKIAQKEADITEELMLEMEN